MTDPSARITRVDTLVASPGCCAVCGKDKCADGFAATDNFDFEYYGTVYFCAECIGEYARVFGYKSPSELDDLDAKLSAQATELETLRQAVVLLENTVDNLTGLSVLRPHDSASSPSDASESMDAAPAESVNVTEPVGVGESDEPEVSEPSVESGRDDVRDSTDDIDALLAL